MVVRVLLQDEVDVIEFQRIAASCTITASDGTNHQFSVVVPVDVVETSLVERRMTMCSTCMPDCLDSS
jgi:hypothetical protein